MAQLIFEAVSNYGPIPALLLQAAVLSRFLNARNRDYPLAILFSVVLFLLTITAYFFNSLASFLTKATFLTKREFLVAYSAADLFMHVLLVALMLQLTRKTLKSLDLNSKVIYHLAVLSVLIPAVAYFYFSNAGTTPLATILLKTRQILSFWMVLLNLYWWTLLLRKRQLDRRVLLLSAGIGLMMTGQVIGDGIATLAQGDYLIALFAAVVMYSTHFASLLAWFNAFRVSNAISPAASSVQNLNQSLT